MGNFMARGGKVGFLKYYDPDCEEPDFYEAIYGTWNDYSFTKEWKVKKSVYSTTISGLLKNLRKFINKFDMSYIEQYYVKYILQKADNEKFKNLEFIENYTWDGELEDRHVEFKRMHNYEKDKNVYVKKMFFHFKNDNVLWIEYDEGFSWIRIYDLRDLISKHEPFMAGDTLYFYDNVNYIYEVIYNEKEDEIIEIHQY